MNLKYIGEAVALLGIAYSIFRWIARNIGEADARAHFGPRVDGARLGGPASAMTDRAPPRASPPDAAELEAAAAMFGIAVEDLMQMDARERALLLSGHAAARDARRRSGDAGNGSQGA